MTWKEIVRFAYGLFMGTSTPYLKPAKRYLFPPHRHDIDPGLRLLLGGSGICGVVEGGDERFIINTNQGKSAQELRRWIDENPSRFRTQIAVCAAVPDFAAGLVLYPETQAIFLGGKPTKDLISTLSTASRARTVTKEERIEIPGESILLIPVGPAATGSDLAIHLEKRSVLFLGALFFNRIHPVLRMGSGLDVKRWTTSLETLLDRFEPRIVVPAEGDLATVNDVRTFISYLKALTDSGIEFSQCRRDYDWMEIPSSTSLEENFDLLRRRSKEYTSLG